MRSQKMYALIALVLGLLGLGTAALLMRGARLQPATFPINLHPGQTESSRFRVDIDADYLIDLEVDRALPFDQLNCMLGISPGTPQACESGSSVDIRWRVTSSNTVVAKGSSQGPASGAWGATVSRTLGSFPGRRSNDYVLQIESLKDSSALSPANPRVAVHVHPMHSKDRLIVAQSLFWVCFAVVGGTLSWLAFAYVRSRRV